MINCKECGKEISNKAKTCPSCGSPVTKNIGCWGLILAIVFIGFIISIIVSSTTSTPTHSSGTERVTDSSLRMDSEVAVKMLIENKFIHKIELNLNRAYVNWYMWNSMDVEKKEAVSKAIAFYCGYQKGTGLFWADIYDWRSGKKLANYSHSWGFKIY